MPGSVRVKGHAFCGPVARHLKIMDSGMKHLTQDDWNPASDEVLRDQRAAFDTLRERCPVAHSDFLGWSVFRHADVVRALHDPATFSSVVSSHVSVPNGMDPPEHTAYRRLIEPYFAPGRMAAFAPACRQIAAVHVASLLAHENIELMDALAHPFAVQVQCEFLGWPAPMHEALRLWTRKNHQATLAGDRVAMASIAREFEGYVDDLLRSRHTPGAHPEHDIAASLRMQQVNGRPLRDDEIASILRNWTVGEVGTIAASIGILAHYLAEHTALQQRLRAQPSLLPAAIEEILRIHGPLVANRRVATRAVEMGGRQIGAGDRVSLNWIAANRDPAVFSAPDEFRLDRDPAANLLYGAGIHVCPGAPLARMELIVVMEELLAQTEMISLPDGKLPALAVYPSSGFESLSLQVR
ncbi:cytochrome P450 [Polaromonas sp. CG_9.5]|nr:cytochrome P450 [Polaromonas sp. CG_9.5]